jgi:hypothetical protein
MLADRIHNTLRFFDLQHFPLTAFEVHRFLITDLKTLRERIDGNYELLPGTQLPIVPVSFDTILTQLKVLKFEKTITEKNGFYCLAGHENIIDDRQQDYLLGLKRERLLNKYIAPIKHIPFVRSVVLLGSQAMGQQKADSDIDLFVITDEKFIGTARFLLTLYFQILGIRRYGKKIANRFCLNHYLAGPRAVIEDKNLYTAFEYVKFRPLVNGSVFREFLSQNKWVNDFFPHAKPIEPKSTELIRTALQDFLEKLFQNGLGRWFEQKMIATQLKRINKGEFTISNSIELSFHPDNRKQKLFQNFFDNSKTQRE